MRIRYHSFKILQTVNYCVSHKVEISERFKNLRLEFKGESSNLKHEEKIDE